MGMYGWIIPVRPIENWPGKMRSSTERQDARFKAGWSSTEKLLNRELGALNATNAVMHLDIRQRDLRKDGDLRANARPNGPAVLVAFNHPELGALAYPCDLYRDHKDNVRAIAKALEALRMVDRYGVTRKGEQYAGWQQLPPGSGKTEGGMTLDAAYALIAELSEFSKLSIRELRKTYDSARRRALWKAHPDHGGCPSAYHRFNMACEMIAADFEERLS